MIFEWNEKITFHAFFHSFFTKFWPKIWTVNVIFQLRHKNPLSFKIRTYKKVVIRGEKIYYSTSQLLRLKLILSNSIFIKSMFLKNISLSHRIFFSNKTKNWRICAFNLPQAGFLPDVQLPLSLRDVHRAACVGRLLMADPDDGSVVAMSACLDGLHLFFSGPVDSVHDDVLVH